MSPCLFKFYEEYITQNARPDESQAGIKISRRNINNLRYAGDTTAIWASLMAQQVKNMPVVQETQVQSLGPEDPLEEEMATHPSILAWEIPWTEEHGRL